LSQKEKRENEKVRREEALCPSHVIDIKTVKKKEDSKV